LFSNWGNDTVNITYSEVTYDEWHHFAVTANGTTVRLYVDGVSVGAANWSSPETIYRAGVNPVVFGIQNTKNQQWLSDGIADELVIYNRVLSGTEIQELAAGTCPLTTP
jgi:hypothetical protein